MNVQETLKTIEDYLVDIESCEKSILDYSVLIMGMENEGIYSFEQSKRFDGLKRDRNKLILEKRGFKKELVKLIDSF